jgi:hypothetical protein
MSDGVTLLTEYIDKKKESLALQKESLDSVANLNPAKMISDSLENTVSNNILGDLDGSPLLKLGKDFIAEQVSKNASKIINNIETTAKKKVNALISKALAPVEQLQNMIFDSITAILTAQNDLAMFFIQKLAKEAVQALDDKIAINTEMQKKVKELHNIVSQMVEGEPFFKEYLAQLRRALLHIYEARNDLVIVRNTLEVRDRWLKVRYNGAKDKLIAAEKLLEPEKNDNKDGDFGIGGLLSGVGIPSRPEQLTLLLALPQKIKEVLACANGYFIANLKANALLLAFIQAQGSFTNSSNRKLKQFTINTIDNIVERLDELVTQMATQLNGSPSSILGPDNIDVIKPNPELVLAASTGASIDYTDESLFQVAITRKLYEPDSLKTSALAMNWLIDLKMIIGYFKLVPGPALESIQNSNDALAKYEKAVKFIKSKGNINFAGAQLTATEGREETGELESQLTTYVMTAGKALINKTTGKKAVSLGKTISNRLTLSITQDTEIKNALLEFANAQLSTDAQKRTGENVFKMLDKFGLDRASDFLKKGLFGDFFNMDGKTATYAGAALAAISALKECLTTAEDREQLTQAQREIEREQKSKELLVQRAAAVGYKTQLEGLDAREADLETLSQKTQIAGKKCGLGTDMLPSNLLKNLGPIVGVSALGNSSIQKSLSKISKGVF